LWGKFLSDLQLGFADEEGESACCLYEADCDREGGIKALRGPERYYVGLGGREAFAAASEYIDVRQCKGASDFT
jgi:hypothetical protein